MSYYSRNSWSSEASKYHGLYNQGSTCYLNSVLQVLFMTEDFREAVDKHAPGNPDCIDGQLAALFSDLNTHTGRTVEITEKLGIVDVHQQRDAAEAFEKVMAVTSPDASKIFQGELTHRTRCSECSARSDADGLFWYLPLALLDSHSKNYSVKNCVEEFFKKSSFSGENQMYCDICKAKYDATVECEMTRQPEVLMLLLKRFEFNYRFMSFVKNTRAVAVPYILHPQNQTYELYAMVEHVGSLRSGHYTATIKSKDERDGEWYKFSDFSVTKVYKNHSQGEDTENSSTVSQNAYLLFYRKKTMDAADTVTPDNMDIVSTNEGSSPPPCDKSEDVSGVKKQEDGEDVKVGDPEESGSISREKETPEGIVSDVSTERLSDAEDKDRGVSGEQSRPCCPQGYNGVSKHETNEERRMKDGEEDTDDQVGDGGLSQESVKVHENTGLDEVSETRPDHPNTQDEMRRAQRSDKGGDTGDEEEGDVERTEEKKDKAGADEKDSPKYGEDNPISSYTEQTEKSDVQGDDEQPRGDDSKQEANEEGKTKNGEEEGRLCKKGVNRESDGNQFQYNSWWSWSSEPSKYHGLYNQGSTCYLNSVLQVLFMTEDFREAVDKHAPGNPDCIDGQLAALFSDLNTHTGRTVEITQKLGIVDVHQQRDAAEAFEKVMAVTSPDASKIFGGELTHRTRCSECRTGSDADGPFWYLPLALLDSHNKKYSVKNGVEAFFKTSTFSGDNQMYCDTCESKCDATIECEMTRQPEVLMLLLKRFEFNYRFMSFVKNTRAVAVPYILHPQNQTYELYAMVEHGGSLRSGHYTATIKSKDDSDDEWYKFNDSSVTKVNKNPFPRKDAENSSTVSQNAYLLFYRKKTMDAADTVTPDNMDIVSTNEGSPPPPCGKSEDVSGVKKQEDEDAVTVGDSEESGSISRNLRNLNLSDAEDKDRGVSGEQSRPCCPQGCDGVSKHETNEERRMKDGEEDSDDQVGDGGLSQESVKVHENTGLDHPNTQDEMRHAQRSDKGGDTGDEEEGDVERTEEKKGKGGADDKDSPKYGEDDGQQRGDDERAETSTTHHDLSAEDQGDQNRPEGKPSVMHSTREGVSVETESGDFQGDKEPKVRDGPRRSEGVEDQDVKGSYVIQNQPESECGVKNGVMEKNQAKEPESKGVYEQLSRAEPERNGGPTENQAGGSDEKMRLSNPQPGAGRGVGTDVQGSLSESLKSTKSVKRSVEEGNETNSASDLTAKKVRQEIEDTEMTDLSEERLGGEKTEPTRDMQPKETSGVRYMFCCIGTTQKKED